MTTATTVVPGSADGTSRRHVAVIVLSGIVGVTLGVLWIGEGWTKYHAGFGAADIRLVADSAAQNSRVPGFFQESCTHILGPNAGLFGFAMPALEVALGIGFIAVVASRKFADRLPTTILARMVGGGSVFTLTTYWLSDQLIWEYPIMVLLSTFLLATSSSRPR